MKSEVQFSDQLARDQAWARFYSRNGAEVHAERVTNRRPSHPKSNRERKAEWASKYYQLAPESSVVPHFLIKVLQ